MTCMYIYRHPDQAEKRTLERENSGGRGCARIGKSAASPRGDQELQTIGPKGVGLAGVIDREGHHRINSERSP